MTSPKVKESRKRGKVRRINYENQLFNEIKTHEALKGELPKLDIVVIESKLAEVESVKTVAEVDKAKLESDAAKIDDTKNPELKEAALKEIETKEMYLTSLEKQKLELEFQERLTKDEITKEDEVEIAKRKEAQANLIEEYKTKLIEKGLLPAFDETPNEERKRKQRLENRALKLALSRKEADAILEAEEREKNKDKTSPT